MGSHSLLQGIFPTQGLNLGAPHCRQILYYCATWVKSGTFGGRGKKCHSEA